jgi:class 3 adenylate cyclase
MFCDLVDSTGIAARLDAEEWRDLVNAYLENASAAVTEMGGRVARKLGGRVPRQLQHAPHLDIGIVRAEQRSKNCKSRSGIARNFVEQFQVAGELGFEPRLTESEPSFSALESIA